MTTYYCPYEVLDDGSTLTLATYKCFAKAVQFAHETPCVVGIDQWDDDKGRGDIVWTRGVWTGRQ